MDVIITINSIKHKVVKDENASCSKCSLKDTCMKLCAEFELGRYEYFQRMEE